MTLQKHVAAGVIVNISISDWHQTSNRANVFASGNSSSSQAPTCTFLRSNRTLQHRQALRPSGSSASSDSSLLSQQSGLKFGRAARVGALGVAAEGPLAPQRGTVLQDMHNHVSTFAPIGDGKTKFSNCCLVSCCAVPCCAEPHYAVPRCAMLCCATLRCAMLCCVMLRCAHAMPCSCPHCSLKQR